MTLGEAIRESNAGYYDLHLALHSNAAPEELAGKIRGTDVYYYPYSALGKRPPRCWPRILKRFIPSRTK